MPLPFPSVVIVIVFATLRPIFGGTHERFIKSLLHVVFAHKSKRGFRFQRARYNYKSFWCALDFRQVRTRTMFIVKLDAGDLDMPYQKREKKMGRTLPLHHANEGTNQKVYIWPLCFNRFMRSNAIFDGICCRNRNNINWTSPKNKTFFMRYNFFFFFSFPFQILMIILLLYVTLEFWLQINTVLKWHVAVVVHICNTTPTVLPNLKLHLRSTMDDAQIQRGWMVRSFIKNVSRTCNTSK